MKLAITCLFLTGCFTSWAATQAAGGQRILEERSRTERVPLDDAKERLSVTMPFASTATDRYAFICHTTQTATDVVHQSAFRYGSKWKKITLIVFALEAGLAVTTYFAGDMEKPNDVLTAGFFAADALGTAALVFIPRKEIYRREVKPVYTPIRSDCPDGMSVEVAGESFPIDAAGHLSELGEAALETWRREPASQPARITYGDRTLDVRIGMSAVFDVSLGALSGPAANVSVRPGS